MKHACIVKLKGQDRYIGKSMADVDRDRAPIEHLVAAEARAARRFGKDWQNHAEVIEVTQEEYMRHLGAKGGRRMTPAKMGWLTNGRAATAPVKLFQGELNGVQLMIGARTVKRAAELLEANGYGTNLYFTVYRKFRSTMYDKRRHHWPKYKDESIWIRNGKDWKKVL